MLERPDLQDVMLVACLRDDYRLYITDIEFLPLGADVKTAVYRVADDATAYFLKLRRGAFDETVVAIPRFLRDQGIAPIIAPLATHAGSLWTRVDAWAVVLYPYVAGQDGFHALVAERHWVELGAALRDIHNVAPPLALQERILREDFSPYWREMVKTFQAQVEDAVFEDPVAARLAAFMRAKRAEINDLVTRAERLARILQARPRDFVLCHGDMHAANLLIGADGSLYIVDWDTLIFAPRERDLMFVGAGLGIGDTPEQAALFYQGYGQTDVDALALAYYRYERIVEDIAAFCQQLLSTSEGGADRERALGFLVGQFQPGDVIERAYTLDKSWNHG